MLFNLVTKTIMSDEIKTDILRRNEVGQKLYVKFIEERLEKNLMNIWDPIPNTKLKMWKYLGKNVKLKLKDSIVELKESNSLLIRMMVVARSRPSIDIKMSTGLYE